MCCTTKRRRPGKRRLGPILVVVLLVVVVLGLWLAWCSPADQIQGMADADTINVAAKITARVAELKVREGDRVQPGQVLFLLDSPEVAAKEQQAARCLPPHRRWPTRLTKARAAKTSAPPKRTGSAEAGATLAEATYQRVQNLFNEGVMTRQKRDEAHAQATSSRELARAARAQYDMALAGAREQDKRAAQGQCGRRRARWPRSTPRVPKWKGARRWPARSTAHGRPGRTGAGRLPGVHPGRHRPHVGGDEPARIADAGPEGRQQAAATCRRSGRTRVRGLLHQPGR
jgi:multidrug efflux pump subunit AcrA (membrane-fusion protein)